MKALKNKTSSGHSKAVGRTESSDGMKQRSEDFLRVLTDVAMDDDHMVQSVIHLTEMRKIRNDDLACSSWYYRVASPAGFYAYEDSGMTTAGLLAAESLRYQVTHNPDAKTNADKAFQGIVHIYHLGKQRTEGYFPKPYDKKISDQISRDQYIFVMRSLEYYYAIADEVVRKQICRMVGKMAEYWMSINYSDSYFGLPVSSHLTDLAGSLFLGIIRMAYRYTGDEKFKKEYDRLFKEERLGERMPETLKAQFLRGEPYDGAMYFRQSEQDIMMKTLALDHLWDADIQNRPQWRKALQAFYNEDLQVQYNPESGLSYFITGLDPKTGKTFLTEPKIIEELTDPLDLQWIRFGGLRQTPGSVQIAFNAVIIGDRLEMKPAINLAGSILEKISLDKFKYFTVPDSSHIPPNQMYAQHFAYASFFAIWLWTYWLGRLKKFW